MYITVILMLNVIKNVKQISIIFILINYYINTNTLIISTRDNDFKWLLFYTILLNPCEFK